MLLVYRFVSLFEQRGLQLKIINVTSGAANRPYGGWSTYCTGKAALKFFLDCLVSERPDIRVVHIDLGVLDTDMQKSICLSSKADFLQRLLFLQLHQEGRLGNPIKVAREIIRQEALL
jgi:benzil reductase ((S)-benzoin forming)